MGMRFAARASAGGCALVLLLALGIGAALAQDKTYTMKISLPTLNDPSYVFAQAYAAAVEKDSNGRIKPQVFPSSQLGSIPRLDSTTLHPRQEKRRSGRGLPAPERVRISTVGH